MSENKKGKKKTEENYPIFESRNEGKERERRKLSDSNTKKLLGEFG
jgi:hypothetical protein